MLNNIESLSSKEKKVYLPSKMRAWLKFKSRKGIKITHVLIDLAIKYKLWTRKNVNNKIFKVNLKLIMKGIGNRISKARKAFK